VKQVYLIVDDILEAAQKHDLTNKITDISAHNTNTKFQWIERIDKKTSN
jgi:hypothetical protein